MNCQNPSHPLHDGPCNNGRNTWVNEDAPAPATAHACEVCVYCGAPKPASEIPTLCSSCESTNAMQLRDSNPGELPPVVSRPAPGTPALVQAEPDAPEVDLSAPCDPWKQIFDAIEDLKIRVEKLEHARVTRLERAIFGEPFPRDVPELKAAEGTTEGDSHGAD